MPSDPDPTSLTDLLHRLRGSLAGPVGVLVGYAAILLLARAGAFDGLPLDSPRVATPLALASLALVPAVLVRRDRRWWLTRVLPIVAAVAVGELLLAWYLRASDTITDVYPRSFLVWLGIALVTALAAAAGWRHGSSRRRVAAMTAVPTTVALCFVLINSHYGYWPTLGDLLGHPFVGQVSASTLRNEVASPLPPDLRHVGRPGHHLGVVGSLGHTALAPSPADVGWHDHRGQYAVIDIPATVSHFHHRAGAVYLPPAYFTPARSGLPVIEMLAGTPSGPSTLASAGHAVSLANAFADHHDGLAPVIIFPDANGYWHGDTECVDGTRGRAETYLTVDVVNFATRNLHLSADPRRWGILGFSEGGTCALDLTLGHPDTFRTFVDLAGDLVPNVPGSTLHKLFGGSMASLLRHDPAFLMSHHRYPELMGWFAAGHRDHSHVKIGLEQLHEARAAGVQAWWMVGPGGHGFQFTAWAIRQLMGPLFHRMDPGAWPPRAVERPAT